MKRFSLLLLSAISLSLALSACSSSRTGLLKLYQRNSGDIVRLSVGETMDVVLDGDPATDIHWIKVPDDPEILEQLGGTDYEHDLESHSAERKLVTHFRATAPGRTRLQLSYSNPADGRAANSFRITPDRVFEIWVVVREVE